MKTKQIEIARKINLSQGMLSEILNGKREVTKTAALKFGQLTGLRWVEFMDMAPERIGEELDKAMKREKQCQCDRACA